MTVRLFIAVIVLSVIAGCGDVYRYFKSGEVSWALKKELRDKGSSEIALPSLAHFEWDEMYVFGPYEMAEEICKQLNIDRVRCDEEITVSSVDDGEMILVFRDKGRVVHVELHSRYHGDFTKVHYGVPIARKKALFEVQYGERLPSGHPQLFLLVKQNLDGPNSTLRVDAPQAAHH